MRVDGQGALQPVSPAVQGPPDTGKRVHRDRLEERAAEQRVIAHLSLAFELGSKSSFTLRLEVPHAQSP
jgi:hypothetical protein